MKTIVVTYREDLRVYEAHLKDYIPLLYGRGKSISVAIGELIQIYPEQLGIKIEKEC